MAMTLHERPRSLRGAFESFYRKAKGLRRKVLYRDYHAIGDDYGVLLPIPRASPGERSYISMTRDYRARSELALDVASNYPGGDYFEFGSSGLNSFRSFLAAFELYNLDTKFPDAKFYAFDIFGNPDQGAGPSSDERAYFEHWRNPVDIAAPLWALDRYRTLRDRCVIVPGYFSETLNDELKATMRMADRQIGFAYLDCSMAPSYKQVFDFLLDVIKPRRMFIAMDEYFEYHKPPIHPLYQDFAAKAKERYGLDSLYIRNAGAFGALFCLMPSS